MRDVTTTTLLSCPVAVALLKSAHPEPGGAVTVAMTLLAVGVGHRGWASPGWPPRSAPPSSRSAGSTTGWTRTGTGWRGATDKPVAAGAVARRTVGIAGLIASLAIPLLGPAVRPGRDRLHHAGRRLRAALRLAAEVHRRSRCCPTWWRSGCCRRSWCWRCPGIRRRRPGWSRRARCSAAARTSPTCCPTWPTTPRPACAACRTGSARPGRRSPPRRCCWPRPSPWCSDRPGRRRGRASRPPRPPSWSCPWAGTRPGARAWRGRWRCSAR